MLRKWLIVLLVPFGFQIAFLGLLLKNQRSNAAAQAKAIHTKDVINHAQAINESLVTARANMLGLAMSRNAASNPFDSVVAEIPSQILKLKDLISDNVADQAARLEEIEVLINEYLLWIQKTHRMLMTEGQYDAALVRIGTQHGKKGLDVIQKEMGTFLKIEEGLDMDRLANLKNSSARLLSLIMIGSLLTLASAVILGVVFTLGLAKRIDVLAENARRLAEGKAMLATVGGKDELGQLAQTFEQMAATLREREQENEMFIYSVSHDLRSPLVNLQGFSRELSYTAEDLRTAVAPLAKSPEVAARLAHLLDKDMPDAIHFIQNAVSRLSAIIDSLLRLSRAGRVEYQMQPLAMNEILARVVEAQSNSTAEKGAVIVVGELPQAWGDPTIVEQVFANVLSNAVKYLDPSRKGRIEVRAEPRGDDTPDLQTYSVTDNGLGIAEGHQAKLFRAFQRLHPGVAEGEGIGLALVRRMVDRHGGKIWAKSQAGAGSVFYVSLPSGDRLSAAEPSPRRTASTIGKRL